MPRSSIEEVFCFFRGPRSQCHFEPTLAILFGVNAWHGEPYASWRSVDPPPRYLLLTDKFFSQAGRASLAPHIMSCAKPARIDALSDSEAADDVPVAKRPAALVLWALWRRP